MGWGPKIKLPKIKIKPPKIKIKPPKIKPPIISLTPSAPGPNTGGEGFGLPKITIPGVPCIKPPTVTVGGGGGITVGGMPCVGLPPWLRHRLPDWQCPSEPWMRTHVCGAVEDLLRRMNEEKKILIDKARAELNRLYSQWMNTNTNDPAYLKIKKLIDQYRDDLPPEVKDIIDKIFPPDSEPGTPIGGTGGGWGNDAGGDPNPPCIPPPAPTCPNMPPCWQPPILVNPPCTPICVPCSGDPIPTCTPFERPPCPSPFTKSPCVQPIYTPISQPPSPYTEWKCTIYPTEGDKWGEFNPCVKPPKFTGKLDSPPIYTPISQSPPIDTNAPEPKFTGRLGGEPVRYDGDRGIPPRENQVPPSPYTRITPYAEWGDRQPFVPISQPPRFTGRITPAPPGEDRIYGASPSRSPVGPTTGHGAYCVSGPASPREHDPSPYADISDRPTPGEPDPRIKEIPDRDIPPWQPPHPEGKRFHPYKTHPTARGPLYKQAPPGDGLIYGSQPRDQQEPMPRFTGRLGSDPMPISDPGLRWEDKPRTGTVRSGPPSDGTYTSGDGVYGRSYEPKSKDIAQPFQGVKQAVSRPQQAPSMQAPSIQAPLSGTGMISDINGEEEEKELDKAHRI